MFDFKPVASSLYDHLVFELWYHLLLWLIMFCRYAWLWPLFLSYLVAPSLLLAFTCTEREYFSCIQLQKPKFSQRVHYKFLCMVFQAIPSKFSCATFQKPSNTSHFVTLFLAHEDLVVGFSIFHIELSTPRLACFICSSLILQESWSDHCNL
jgi:hypothetical protein